MTGRRTTYNGTVLVAGATGRTGRLVVDRLLSRGIDCRLFVRSGEKALGLFGPEIVDSLAIGSIASDLDVMAAVKGCRAVICTIGGAAADPSSPPPSAIDRDGVIRLAAAAKQAGVGTFVLVSSLAVTKPDHPLNKYGQVLTMKLEGENAVRELYSEPGFRYTVLRPGGLLDGPPMQHMLQFDTGDRITGSIDRIDVAEVAVLSLWRPEAAGVTFELVRGGEALQESLEPFFHSLPPRSGA